MINFIVADDESFFAKEVSEIINKIMMKNSLDYKIHVFEDYDINFLKIINADLTNKIYILDIETKSASGLDMAKKIRKNDIDSIIIFATAHDELSGMVAKTQYMILTFICKFDDYSTKIKEAINTALVYVGGVNSIRFNDRGTLYTIPIKDILYVTRDTIDRKCVIRTTCSSYRVNIGLSEMKELSKNVLFQSHRCCLINRSRIIKFDTKKNKMYFDNGEMLDLVSNRYKKELMKC